MNPSCVSLKCGRSGSDFQVFAVMADGQFDTKQRNSLEYDQQAQSSNSQGHGKMQAAANRLEQSTKMRARTRRRMTVESLQRMVNEQLVNELFRSQTTESENSRQPPSSTNRSSHKTSFDSVVCSTSRSQADMAPSTKTNHIFESASKPQERNSSWPFKWGTFKRPRKVHPST